MASPVLVDPATACDVLSGWADAGTCLAGSSGGCSAVISVLCCVALTVEHAIRAGASGLWPPVAPALAEEGPWVTLGGVRGALVACATADPSTPGVVLPAGTHACAGCTCPVACLTAADRICPALAVLTAALGDLG